MTTKKMGMSEETKARLRDLKARQVPPSRREAVDWMAACDRLGEMRETAFHETAWYKHDGTGAPPVAQVVRERLLDHEVDRMTWGHNLHTPSRVPALALEVLKAR